jgi:hypothetical protein
MGYDVGMDQQRAAERPRNYDSEALYRDLWQIERDAFLDRERRRRGEMQGRTQLSRDLDVDEVEGGGE